MEKSVSIKITGDATSATRAAKETKDAYQRLGKNLDDTSRAAKETNKHLDALGETARKTGKLESFAVLATGVWAFGNSVKAVLGVMDGMVGAIVNTNIQFEKLSNTLKFATGSAQAAATEMQYLRTISGQLGLELTTAAQAYGKLAASARGTSIEGQKSRQIFEAVASASTVMGLSAEETSGALLAISQMISKGTVAAEELRGQLGERLPGAFQIAARAMGVTTAELGKMLEQGQVIADDFLPKFAAELKKSLGDAPQEAINTTQAKLNQLSNAWTDFKKNIADSGVITLVLKVVEGSNNAMKWFSHLVFNDGELADSQRRLNNPERLKALRAEQDLLISGGNNLDPANTLERRQKRLAEIAAEIRKLQKEIGIVANGNALPGNRAITGDVVMPLTAGSQLLASSGKDKGGGYGADINKLHEQQQQGANKAAQIALQQQNAYAQVSVEIAKYADGLTLAEAAGEKLTQGQQLALSIMERIASGTLNLSAADKRRLGVQLEAMLADEKAIQIKKEAIATQEEWQRIMSESDDRQAELANAQLEADQAAADARDKAFADLSEKLQTENEDLNTALIVSDRKRAKAQIDLEHQRALDRINSLMLESEKAQELIEQETRNYELRLKKIDGDLNSTKNFMKDLGATFTSAFEDAIAGGKKFSDVLAGLAQDIERLLTRRFITDPLMKGIDSLLDNFDFGSLRPSANGNVFSGAPGLHQYVNTVQTSPRAFGFNQLHAFASGGVFAEAGPEAVMPLKRMGNGRLGVEASGGGATNVTVNLIEAPGRGGEVSQRRDDNGGMTIDVMVEMIEQKMSRNLSRGNGIAPAIERQYGLNRAPGAY